MKRLYVLACSALIASSAFAQKAGMENAVISKDRNASMAANAVHMSSMGERDGFWEDDFSVPENWIIGNTEDDAFVTDLNFEIGTGLEPEGFAAIDPINSTSYDNGIAMVDSDEYGGEDGLDGIENCWIQTANPIDCSEQETVAITFETFYRMWDSGNSDGNEYCLVELSDDGVNWPDYTTYEVGEADPGTRFELWPEMSTQDPVSNPTNIYFNISEFAAGLETLYIRFRWKGTFGYAWMIDDIALQDVPENSLAISANTYADEANTGIPEYGTYTPFQSTDLTFRTDVENIGSEDQLGVTMTVTVNGDEVGTSDATDVLAGETDSLIIGGYAVPDAPGIYNIEYQINGPNEDFDPSDNMAMQDFQVTDFQFGRDQDGISFIQPAADFADGEWRAGPFYDIFEDGMVYGIDIALWDWDDFEPGGTMTAYIMNPDAEGIDDGDVYAFGEEIEVPENNLNTIDDEGALKWTTVRLDEPYEVFAGDLIHACAGGFNTDFRMVGEETTIPLGGVTYESGGWTNFVNVNWAVRLNFDVNASAPEIVKSENFALNQNFPNPATASTRISYDLETAGSVNFEIYDVTGKLVMNEFQGTLPAGNHVIDVNVADFPAGVYQYSLIVDGERITRPMMVK